MSYEILKNVRITKEKISFDYASNNVFPQYFRHHEEENNQENGCKPFLLKNFKLWKYKNQAIKQCNHSDIQKIIKEFPDKVVGSFCCQ